MEKRSEMTMDELLALPVIVDFKTAFRALGVGHTEAYRLAAAGEFEGVTGCPVRQRGRPPPARMICAGPPPDRPASRKGAASGPHSAGHQLGHGRHAPRSPGSGRRRC
jgi:hypothetical protein